MRNIPEKIKGFYFPKHEVDDVPRTEVQCIYPQDQVILNDRIFVFCFGKSAPEHKIEEAQCLIYLSNECSVEVLVRFDVTKSYGKNMDIGESEWNANRCCD
jgi:hypothetical protein